MADIDGDTIIEGLRNVQRATQEQKEEAKLAARATLTAGKDRTGGIVTAVKEGFKGRATDLKHAVRGKYDEAGGALGIATKAGSGAVKAPFKAGLFGLGLGWGLAKLGLRGAVAAHSKRKNFVVFLILALLFHVVDWTRGFPRYGVSEFWTDPMWGMQLAFAFIFWILFFWDGHDDLWFNFRKLMTLVGVGTVVYFFPQIVFYISQIPMIEGRLVNIVLNPMIHPIWLYFGLMTYKDSVLAEKILTGLVLFWTVFFLFQFMAQGTDFGKETLTPGDYKNLVELGEEWIQGVRNFGSLVTTGVWGGLRGAINQTWQQATGGDFYYTGEVDRNAEEKLGVYIEDLEPASPEFYDDEPVSVWATIEAKTIDKVVPIDVECYTYDPKTKPKDEREEPPKTLGTLTPTDQFTVDRYEVEDVECYFPRLPNGRQSVGFSADFEFQTQAYYRTYFMDINTLRSYRTEDIDILREFGIKDTDPKAIYTNGPLMIGIRVKEPPVGIGEYKIKDSTEPPPIADKISMRITIDNAWKGEGEVKDITRMIIMIPNGMRIISNDKDEIKCSEFIFEETDCSAIPEIGERCDEELNQIYSLKKTEGKNISFGEFQHISCPILLDADEVLGNNPITAKFFKVLIDYDYEIEKETMLNIKKSDIDIDELTDGVGVSRVEREVVFDPDIDDETYLGIYSLDESHENKENEEEYSRTVLDSAKKNKISYFLIKAIIMRESEWDVDAVGDNGNSLGLMQVAKGTASDLNCGDNYIKPELNIPCGTRYLGEMVDYLKTIPPNASIRNVAAGYNGGRKALNPSSDCEGQMTYECEMNEEYSGTRQYVKDVENIYDELARQVGAVS